MKKMIFVLGFLFVTFYTTKAQQQQTPEIVAICTYKAPTPCDQNAVIKVGIRAGENCFSDRPHGIYRERYMRTIENCIEAIRQSVIQYLAPSI